MSQAILPLHDLASYGSHVNIKRRLVEKRYHTANQKNKVWTLTGQNTKKQLRNLITPTKMHLQPTCNCQYHQILPITKEPRPY